MPSPKLVHFTEGGPWHGYTRQSHIDEWLDEFSNLLGEDNPRMRGIQNITPMRVNFEVIYEAK